MRVKIPEHLRTRAMEEKGLDKVSMKQSLLDASGKNPHLKQVVVMSSMFGILYYIGIMWALMYVTWNITLPYFFDESTEMYFGYTMLDFLRMFLVGIIVELNLNYFLIFWYSNFYRKPGALPSSDPGSSARFCDVCKHNIPPRAHHCFLCDRCILKRDHHCFFTGRCVGLQNQSFFTVFCFYGFVGSSFCTYFIYAYLSHEMHPFFSSQWYDYIFPVLFCKWVIGRVTFYIFSMVFLLYLAFATTCASAGFQLWQLYIISQGQTSYEMKKEITKYSKSTATKNFQEVLGKIPVLQYAFPLPFLLPTNDGVTWDEVKVI